MSKLTPNATANVLGVSVHEKIIPDGTRWQDATKAKKAGFSAGALYKAQRKLSGGTGKPKFVTIHNTNDLANVHDDAEQYTRATINQNMNSSRVHYYVDDTGAWQNLKAGTGLFPADPVGSAEVSWHSGDGSAATGGNETSISMEIIMAETPATDAKAYDNGARMAAWLLHKHGLTINDLVTHTYWVNKSAGKSFDDRDTQCTNPIRGKKWCPTYIFNSNNPATAKKNWQAFKATVKKYLDQLNGTAGSAPSTPATPAAKGTKIMGEAVATPEQAQKYAKDRGAPQSVIDMIQLYWTEGKAEGVRGDVAFAQSCLETGNFLFKGSAVTLSQNNFCGMGVTGNGTKGNSFATPQLGIRSQIQHLKGYASKDALKQTCVDPRFKYLADIRGCAEYVEWLGQKENPLGKGWATGAGYGDKIIRILNAVISTNADTGSTATGTAKPATPAAPAAKGVKYKVTATVLNIRKGPGTSYGTSGTITDQGVYTIMEIKSGTGSKAGWGRLKSGAGWVSMDYMRKI